jgi:hypothetical protein
MRVLRVLVWLVAAFTLAVPQLGTHAQAATTEHADMHCAGHGDAKHSDGKQGIPDCCTSALCATAVLSASEVLALMSPVTQRPTAGSPPLHGFMRAKEPPPPRI